MSFIAGWIARIGILEFFSVLLILMNMLAFFLYVIDKRKAVKNKWRISENTLIFFTLAFGGIGALLGMRLARHKTKHTKFRIATAIGLIVALIPAVHIIHGLTLDKTVRYAELEFHSENWPPDLNGYRIAFLTDMHTITHDAMGKVAAELNARNVDLLLLGGDFSMSGEHYNGTIREIAMIKATDGIFGVEGNHDDYRRIFAAYAQCGITPLDNNGIRIRDGFYLAGVHDMWNRSPNIEAAIANANTGAGANAGAGVNDFVLLVSHNPDVSMVQSTAGVNLVLSGHTHGGQITFFGIPLYLLSGSITDYGMRFAAGFAESKGGVPVFTCRGVGDYYAVPRIFARPEVVIFIMYSDI